MGGFEVENRELFIMAHEGQKEARDILFEKNAGLIHHVMKRYKSVIMTYKNIEAEDIYQIGSIGLLKAIDRFDTDYGVCFSTYAVPLIIGEIRQFLRGNSIIKVSRSIKENGYKINKLRAGGGDHPEAVRDILPHGLHEHTPQPARRRGVRQRHLGGGVEHHAPQVAPESLRVSGQARPQYLHQPTEIPPP